MNPLAQRLSTLSAEQRALLLKQVGAQLTERQRPSTRIPRRPASSGRAPVSYLQEQLWFLDQLVPGQSTYNVPSVFRLRGPLDLTALRRALTDIVDRHEALRTTLAVEDGEPHQLIAETGDRPHHLVVDDLTDVADPQARLTEAEQRVQEEIRRPFDLAQGPLFRSLLVRLDDNAHLLAVTMHHIVSDGWSQAVLTNELSELYAAHHAGREPVLPELAVQYGDYAAWQRNQLGGEVFDSQLDYWADRLAGLPTMELPLDRPRPATLSYRSAAVSRAIGGDLLNRLRQLSARHNTTLFMTLMAAYQAVLARYSDEDEVVVGTTTSGRDPAELEPLVGYFVNMVVLRTDVSDNPSFGLLLERVRGVVLEAWKHQQVPFEKVVERVQPARDPSRNPLFQVGLQLLGSATQSTEPDLPGLEVTSLDANPGGHPFDLSITATEGPEQLRLVADYSVDLFDEPRVARLLRHLERVLVAAVDAPDTPLAALPLLDGLSDAARAIGAVNTVIHRAGQLYGDNTDAPGLLQALAGSGLTGRLGAADRVVVLGAGGAARAAVYAGAVILGREVWVVNRTPARARALAAGWQGGGEVRAAGPGEVPWGQVGLVINSSSAGLDNPEETPLPGFDFGQLPAHAGVYDMVYKPRRTRLMRDAEAAGLPAENGLGMLAQQARLAFTAWTGVDVPVSVFLAALEAPATGRGAGDAARTEATR